MSLTLRTDAELDAALAALSDAEGASRQEVIRRAVLERYGRTVHAARVEESSDRLVERWGDVLDRLGSGMSEEVEYLDLDDLLGLVRLLAAGPVRDIGLLSGCAQRPASSAFGADAYPDIPTKASALLHSIARTHPLVDGNKRLAWLATVVFLDLNGWTVALNDDEAFALVMSVAERDCEVADIVAGLRAQPLP